MVVYAIKMGHDDILLLCNLHSLPGSQQFIAENITWNITQINTPTIKTVYDDIVKNNILTV